MLIIGIFAFLLAAVAGYFTYKHACATRCPKCGKAFAMSEISRGQTPVTSYDTAAHMGLFTLDLKGNVTGTDARAVPATAYVYSCVDACRFCGFRKERQRTRVRKK